LIFAVTEITPCPPLAIYSKKERSSPLIKIKLSWTFFFKKSIRSNSPVASFIPIIFESWLKEITVSFFKSQPVLDGTLYNICGMSTASLIAL
jgi:hypothetical protein